MRCHMELKPSRDRARTKVKLDGAGRPVVKGDERNPFAALARGINPRGVERRRRPFADTLGATPARDGPFSVPAAGIAAVNPPKGRKRRGADPTVPWLKSK